MNTHPEVIQELVRDRQSQFRREAREARELSSLLRLRRTRRDSR